MGIKNKLYPFYQKYVLPNLAFLKNKAIVKQIQKKGKANILFIVSNLPMWRCQPLYNLLKCDKRFNPQIALLPFSNFDDEQKEKNLQQLHSFFDQQKTPYIDLSTFESPAQYVREIIAPDIIFFPQHYEGIFEEEMNFTSFQDKLLCYTPYALLTFDQPWLYNLKFNNIGWKLYFPSSVDLDCAKREAFNKGRNVVIVGGTTDEQYLKKPDPKTWKSAGNRKRIIWAPHFSISGEGYLHRASFLLLADAMLSFTEKYKDSVQFSFKPHPRLFIELKNNPEWGKKKAEEYFSEWSTRENTQLDTGSYTDLFLSSDAMIHDSGSFTAEYHYTGKPVLFFTQDKAQTEGQLNKLGKAALDAHYIGSTISDIESFILNVVLAGKDPMASRRKSFYEQYLKPVNGKCAAQNIYEDLLNSLKFQ